jgi:hypothetical protein
MPQRMRASRHERNRSRIEFRSAGCTVNQSPDVASRGRQSTRRRARAPAVMQRQSSLQRRFVGARNQYTRFRAPKNVLSGGLRRIRPVLQKRGIGGASFSAGYGDFRGVDGTELSSVSVTC